VRVMGWLLVNCGEKLRTGGQGMWFDINQSLAQLQHPIIPVQEPVHAGACL